MNQSESEKIVDNHVAQLLEHFDSVTILVTQHDGGASETASYVSGGGNYYARIAKANEWLLMDKAQVVKQASKK